MRLRTIVLLAALVLAATFAGVVRYRHHPTSVGFQVLVLKEGPKATWTDHWGNVLIVHVDSDHTLGLNSQKLSHIELKMKLKETLCQRVEKVVLLDADGELTFGEVANAIDTVQSACPASIALLTPNSKKVGEDRDLYLPDERHPDPLPKSVIPETLK